MTLPKSRLSTLLLLLLLLLLLCAVTFADLSAECTHTHMRARIVHTIFVIIMKLIAVCEQKCSFYANACLISCWNSASGIFVDRMCTRARTRAYAHTARERCWCFLSISFVFFGSALYEVRSSTAHIIQLIFHFFFQFVFCFEITYNSQHLQNRVFFSSSRDCSSICRRKWTENVCLFVW